MRTKRKRSRNIVFPLYFDIVNVSVKAAEVIVLHDVKEHTNLIHNSFDNQVFSVVKKYSEIFCMATCYSLKQILHPKTAVSSLARKYCFYRASFVTSSLIHGHCFSKTSQLF